MGNENSSPYLPATATWPSLSQIIPIYGPIAMFQDPFYYYPTIYV